MPSVVGQYWPVLKVKLDQVIGEGDWAVVGSEAEALYGLMSKVTPGDVDILVADSADFAKIYAKLALVNPNVCMPHNGMRHFECDIMLDFGASIKVDFLRARQYMQPIYISIKHPLVGSLPVASPETLLEGLTEKKEALDSKTQKKEQEAVSKRQKAVRSLLKEYVKAERKQLDDPALKDLDIDEFSLDGAAAPRPSTLPGYQGKRSRLSSFIEQQPANRKMPSLSRVVSRLRFVKGVN